MNEKRRKGWLKHLDFVIIDIVCIQLAYLIAYEYRHPSTYMFKGITLYTHLNIILIILDLCYILLQMTYKNILKRSVWKEIQSVVMHNVVVWALAMGYLFLTKQAYWFSRTVFGMALILSLVFMLCARLGWKYILRKKLLKGKNLSEVLIITTKDQAQKMVRRFRARGYNGFNLRGFVITDDDTVTEIERVPVVCSKDEALEYVRTNVVDDVMIQLPEGTAGMDDTIHLLLKMGVVVHIGLDYSDEELPNRTIERIGGYTFLTTSINTVGRLRLTIKRIVDIAAGLVGCAITGVLFVILAPLIYHASPGPIFYSQERVGKNGRRFKIYKFRSMYLDADQRKKDLMARNKMQGNMFKIDNDPRIIGSEKGPGRGIGNFIRRTSLDEFPQFLNILQGDMSLVGTRPPTVDEFEKYDLHHKIRLSMKPGLTGMWQVSGRNRITNFEEIVKLDAEYIEHWTLLLDLEIIFKTFKVVFSRQGAA